MLGVIWILVFLKEYSEKDNFEEKQQMTKVKNKLKYKELIHPSTNSEVNLELNVGD